MNTVEERINDWTGEPRFFRILVSSIFFSFLFGPKRISDREEGESARQDRGDGGEDVEIGAIPAGQAIEGE